MLRAVIMFVGAFILYTFMALVEWKQTARKIKEAKSVEAAQSAVWDLDRVIPVLIGVGVALFAMVGAGLLRGE